MACCKLVNLCYLYVGFRRECCLTICEQHRLDLRVLFMSSGVGNNIVGHWCGRCSETFDGKLFWNRHGIFMQN